MVSSDGIMIRFARALYWVNSSEKYVIEKNISMTQVVHYY